MGRVSHHIKPTAFGMGLIALDLVLSADPKEPIYCWAGGTCGNVLTILSYLGWSTFPVARLNGDSASLRVKADMSRWGVNLAFAEQTPTASTPIITQQNSRDSDGTLTHKFTWSCPKCGAWLPHYKNVTILSAKSVAEKIVDPRVFFFDRLSAGALTLARKCKEMGAVIVFEPSAKGNPRHFAEALELAHIIKYSQERFGSLVQEVRPGKSSILEIQTMGREGLIFRANLPRIKSSKWSRLPAMKVDQVSDSCGCGDWATAGLISKLCDIESLGELKSKPLAEIISALNFGQALAAWNCGFEGARGGMYRVEKRVFEDEISDIMKQGVRKARIYTSQLDTEVPRGAICPACNSF